MAACGESLMRVLWQRLRAHELHLTHSADGRALRRGLVLEKGIRQVNAKCFGWATSVVTC